MSDSKQLSGVAGLKKHEMKTSSIVFMIYCLVAAGAFGIEEMIPASGPGLTILMLLLFPMVWALPISNLVAEMGSILPSEGGAYVWAREALGEFWGFQAGWWGTVSTYITNGTYVALVVNYIGHFYTMNNTQEIIVKVIMVATFMIINLFGIREVGIVSTILSLIVLAAFIAVTVIGFANWNYNPMIPFIPEGETAFSSIGECISICVWMYCGYECISNMAGEVKNPQVIPKGLLIAMPLIALTYVLPTIAGLASIGRWQEWATDGEGIGYTDVFIEYLGPSFGLLFLIVAIIAQCAIFNTYLASGSRGFFVLADDNLSPKFLVKVSKKRGVPYVGILTLAGVTMILSQFDFTTLVKTEVVLMLALYILLSVSAFILRRKIPVESRKDCYVIPGGKKVFALFCALPILIAIIALVINGTDYFLIGLAAISSGPVAYVIIKRIYGGRYKVDPHKYPINQKTKLAVGDFNRLALFFNLAGIFSIIGSFILVWYEGVGAAKDYLEEYHTGLFSNFELMIDVLRYAGLGAIIFGVALLIFSKMVEKNEKYRKIEKQVFRVEQEIIDEEDNSNVEKLII